MGRADRRSDASVVAAVLAGDTEAFSELVTRYRDAYARYAVRMLGSMEDAEDALQSAFVRAYRHLERCRDPSRFGAWLHRIVVNECRSLARRWDRLGGREVAHDVAMELRADVTPGGDAAVRQEIRRALEQLDADQREAFLLKHVEGFSYEEMVQITGVRESALKMRVKRARDRLRESLEGVYHG